MITPLLDASEPAAYPVTYWVRLAQWLLESNLTIARAYCISMPWDANYSTLMSSLSLLNLRLLPITLNMWQRHPSTIPDGMILRGLH